MGKTLQPTDIMIPGQNLESYIQAVSRIPILTADEEKTLAERLYYQKTLKPRVPWLCRI